MHGCNCHFPKLRPLWFPHQPPSTLDALTPCCRHWLCGEPVQVLRQPVFSFVYAVDLVAVSPEILKRALLGSRLTFLSFIWARLPGEVGLFLAFLFFEAYRAGRAAFLRAHLRRAFSSAFESVVACGCLFPELKKLMDTLWYVGLC